MSRYNLGPFGSVTGTLQDAYDGGRTISTTGGIPVQIDPTLALSVSKPDSLSVGNLSATFISNFTYSVSTPTDQLIKGAIAAGGTLSIPVLSFIFFVPVSQAFTLPAVSFQPKTVTVDSNSTTFYFYTLSATLGANLFQVNTFTTYDVGTDTITAFEVVVSPPTNPAYDLVVTPSTSGGILLLSVAFTAGAPAQFVAYTRLEAHYSNFLGF